MSNQRGESTCVFDVFCWRITTTGGFTLAVCPLFAVPLTPCSSCVICDMLMDVANNKRSDISLDPSPQFWAGTPGAASCQVQHWQVEG